MTPVAVLRSRGLRCLRTGSRVCCGAAWLFVGPAELPPPSCRKVKKAKKETLVRTQKKWGMNTVKRTKHDPNSPSHLLEADLHVVQAILYRLPMSRRASPPESQLTPAIPVLTTCFCFAAFCCAASAH